MNYPQLLDELFDVHTETVAKDKGAFLMFPNQKGLWRAVINYKGHTSP